MPTSSIFLKNVNYLNSGEGSKFLKIHHELPKFVHRLLNYDSIKK